MGNWRDNVDLKLERTGKTQTKARGRNTSKTYDLYLLEGTSEGERNNAAYIWAEGTKVGSSEEELRRNELEDLIRRQKEIIEVFKGRSGRSQGKKRRLRNKKATNRSIQELNRELREVNQKIAQCRACLGDPGKEPLKFTRKTKKGKKSTRSLHEGKPLPPSGSWIHIWRG